MTVTGDQVITWPEHDYTPPCEVIAAERMLDGLDPRECGECGESEADCQGSRVTP